MNNSEAKNITQEKVINSVFNSVVQETFIMLGTMHT